MDSISTIIRGPDIIKFVKIMALIQNLFLLKVIGISRILNKLLRWNLYNYCIYMLMNSRGLTELSKISESIRAYTYLVITSQVVSMKSLDSSNIFKREF